MLKTISRLLILSSLLLASCSAILPQPTPTVTPLPTETPTPIPTDTPTPTATIPTASATPTVVTSIEDILPQGTPQKTWHGIAIMPGALSGNGDNKSYRFTIKASKAEIQSFYEKELAAAGWTTLTAMGIGKTGSVMLIFTKDQKTFSVSIIVSDDLFMVMFVE